MTEQKPKRGRPATGVMTPLEHKQALAVAGGRIMQLRLTAEPNAALHLLVNSGEFRTATNAISTAILEAAKRRKLLTKKKAPTGEPGEA